MVAIKKPDSRQLVDPSSGMLRFEWETFFKNVTDVANTLPSAGPVSGFRNAIINGDFRIAQRGTSFTNPASGAFTLDRWKTEFDGTSGTFVASQQPFPLGTLPDEPQFFLQWNQTAAGSGTTFRQFSHRIEGVRTFAGQQVTLSFWAQADAARPISGSLGQIFGTGGAPSATVFFGAQTVTATTAWQKFNLVIPVPSIAGKTIGTNGDDSLGLFLQFPANSTFQINIAEVQLELGSNPTAFERRPIGTELALCQRYYQRISSTNSPSAFLRFASGLAASTNVAFMILNLDQPMRAPPTVALSNVADFGLQSSTTAITGFSFTLAEAGVDRTGLNFTKAGAFTTGQIVLLFANNNNNAFIEAISEL